MAHRVVLRKGSSRLLFFPPTLHSLLHSLISTVSPSSSIFRQAASASSLFSLLVTQFPYFIGIYLSRDVSSFFFFFFSSLVCRRLFFCLIVAYCSQCALSLSSLPFFISFAYDIAASFCPPPVVRTFSAFKSMSFYQCSSRREGEKDFGLSCVFFFYKLNVIIFDFFFVCSFRVVKTI